MTRWDAERSVVISVHDIAPSTLTSTRALLAALDRIGGRPRVLKVIPLRWGSDDLRCSRDCLDLLHEEADAGSEIVLHGLTHAIDTGLARPLGSRLHRARARAFAGDIAEFVTLTAPEMRRRIALGAEILADAGLVAEGFCAPGWLSAPGLPEVLRDAGFRHLVGMTTLTDVRTGRARRLPAVGHMGAGAVHEGLIAAGNWAGGPLLAASPAVKVFLHPARDTSRGAVARVLRGLEATLAERRPVTYAQLAGRVGAA